MRSLSSAAIQHQAQYDGPKKENQVDVENSQRWFDKRKVDH